MYYLCFETFPNTYNLVFNLWYRYNTKSRSFKKIKIFWNEPEHIKLTYRETPLEPTRVMSVFKVTIYLKYILIPIICRFYLLVYIFYIKEHC